MKTIALLVALSLSGCIPTPTQTECHRQGDCRTCVEAFCSWCGSTPGVAAVGGGCHAKDHQPSGCDPIPHVTFCYQGATSPIINRSLPPPDGGTDR